MKSAVACIDRNERPAGDSGLLAQIARRLVIHRLGRIRHGELELVEGGQCYRFGRNDTRFSYTIRMEITDAGFFTRVMLGGVLGAGEAYMDGQWECDNLTGLVELFVVNRDYLDKIDTGLRLLNIPMEWLNRAATRNTPDGSRRNIGAHYDLGNELFELFLDSSMMYSSGIYPYADASLDEASEYKLKRICEKLQLRPDDHVLEIGTGWGGFAIYAAQNYGCRVTTTTLSREQFEYARQRVRQAGLQGRIELLLKDYRELDGQYDKLVSIEMIEAIGYRYFDTYFGKCDRLLAPHGMMLLQSITIADQRYRQAKKSVDFIQRHIFPGGCLPSLAALSNSIAENTWMRVFHLEDIGPHYATTLSDWRKRFMHSIDQVRNLGYPERFIRMWNYYLSYCEGGFRQQAIGTVQLLLTKPECLREPLSSTDH